MADPITTTLPDAYEPGSLAEQLRAARQAKPTAPTPIRRLVPQILRTAEATQTPGRTTMGAPILPQAPKEVLSRAASQEGSTTEGLLDRAEAEGVDLDRMLDEVALGRGADDVLAAARERGAYGLLPSDEARRSVDRLKREHLGLAKELEKPIAETKTRIVQSDKTAGLLGVEAMPEEMSSGREAGALAAAQILRHDPESILQTVEFFKDASPTPLVGWEMVQHRGAVLRQREEQARASRGDFTPLSNEELTNIAHSAARDMTAARIYGLHDHPIFLTSTLDPDRMSWSDIVKKNVEVVGLAPDSTGQVGLIVRPVTAARHIFEIVDLPQSAAVNLVEKAAKGEIGSLSDAATAAKVGAARRRDFMSAAMEQPWARVKVREPSDAEKQAAIAAGAEPPREIREGGHPWLAMGLGLPAAVLFPDLTLGFAKAASITARASKIAKFSLEARAATRLLTEGAKAGLEAGRLDEAADAARLAGKAEEATDLAERAYRQHTIAQAADAGLRGLGKTLAGEARAEMGTLPGQLLDQADQAVGFRLAKEVPDILDTALAKSLPGSLGQELASAHPMVSRAVIRRRSTVEDEAQAVAGTEVVYDYERKLRQLRELSTTMRTAGDAPRAKVVAKKSENTLRKLVDTLDPEKTRGDVGKWEETVRASFKDAVKDPKAWSSARRAEIKVLVPGEDAEAKAVRARAYRLAGGIAAIVQRAANDVDPVMDVERAIEAVKAAAESRTMARIALRSVLARQGGAVLGGAFLEPLEVTARGRRAMPGSSALATVAPYGTSSEPLHRISRLLREEALGLATPGASASEHLAREALQLGATVEGLGDVKDVKALASGIADKVAKGQNVVFSKPILVDTMDPDITKAIRGGELPANETLDALRVWEPTEVMDFEDELVSRRLVDASNVDKLPFKGAYEAVSARGGMASARLEQALHGPEMWKRAARINLYLFFGGNAEAAMMSLPPWLRQGVKAATRPAILSIGEAVRLVEEGDLGKLVDYLSGKSTTFYDGSKSKGAIDATREIARQASFVFEALPIEVQSSLKAAVKIDDAAFAADPTGYTNAIHAFIYGVSPESYPDGLKLLRQNLGAPTFEAGTRLTITPGEHRLARMLLALAGDEDALAGAGLQGALAGREASEFFFTEMHRAYGADNALRASVAAVAVGAAAKAMKTWSGLGMVADEAATTAYESWLMGEKIRDAEMARVVEMAESFGMDAHFVPLNPWAETGAYVPRKAKELLWSAVEASTEDRIGKMKGISNRNASDAIRGVLSFVKSRQVRGGAVVRSKFFTMNLEDHVVQLGTTAGIRSGLTSAIRLAPQNLLTMLSGLPMRLLWTLDKAGVVDYALTEKIRRALQRGGDRMAHAAGAILRVGKYHVSVNAVLDGGDTVIRLGDHVTTAQRLRDVAVQEGIFSNYHTAELTRTMQNVLRVDGEEIVKAGLFGGSRSRARRLLGEMYESVGDISEAWTERERLGAMITLVEGGASPRAAARMVVHALFDYGGSMSSVDRSLLIGVILPYWAYQKNADRFIVDAMFSPWAAYRLGAVRRFFDLGPEGLGNIFYDKIVEPYGIDLDGLLPDQLDRYWGFRDAVEHGYGPREDWTGADKKGMENAFGPWESLPDDVKERLQFGYGTPDEVPEDVRRAIHAILAGKTQFADENRYYLLSSGLHTPGVGLQRGAVPRPRGRTMRRGWQRDTPAIPLTIPARGAALEYMGIKGDDHTYYELMLPEPMPISAFRQGGAILGAELLVAAKMADAAGFLDDGGTDYVSPFAALSEAVDPYRAILVGDVLAAYNDGLSYNRPLSPDVVNVLERLLPWTFPRSRAPIEDPDLPGKVYRRGTAVLPAAYAFPFDNSPLGEANRILLDWHLSAYEGAVVSEAEAQVRVSQLSRILLGLKSSEVSEDILGGAETPRRTTSTTTPNVKK